MTAAPSLPPHPLVAAASGDVPPHRYTCTLTGAEPYLADHVILGERVLPAVTFLELARAAGELALGRPVAAVRGVRFERPLPVGASSRSVYIELSKIDGSVRFEVGDADEVYARGELVVAAEGSPRTAERAGSWRPSGNHRSIVPAVLDELRAQGGENIAVVVGGIIPDADRPALLTAGVRGIFGPGTPLAWMAAEIAALVPAAASPTHSRSKRPRPTAS